MPYLQYQRTAHKMIMPVKWRPLNTFIPGTPSDNEPTKSELCNSALKNPLNDVLKIQIVVMGGYPKDQKDYFGKTLSE